MQKPTNNTGFQVNEDGPRDMLSSPSLTEEGIERVIGLAN